MGSCRLSRIETRRICEGGIAQRSIKNHGEANSRDARPYVTDYFGDDPELKLLKIDILTRPSKEEIDANMLAGFIVAGCCGTQCRLTAPSNSATHRGHQVSRHHESHLTQLPNDRYWGAIADP